MALIGCIKQFIKDRYHLCHVLIYWFYPSEDNLSKIAEDTDKYRNNSYGTIQKLLLVRQENFFSEQKEEVAHTGCLVR